MTRYLALDLETSGLGPKESDILELAAVPLDERLEPRGEGFETLIRPTRDVSAKAVTINGHQWAIDRDGEGWDRALEPSCAWATFDTWLREVFDRPAWIVLVGWNVGFDRDHLRELFDRISATATWDAKWPFHFQIVDLIGVCRYLDAKAGRSRYSYKLDKLAKDLGGELKNRKLHTAMADVETMLEVVKRFE